MANTRRADMRLDDETVKLLSQLSEHLGVNKTSVVKQAVRELARKEGIALEKYYLEYPPFDSDPIKILTSDEYWQDLPANHRYERVEIPGDYDSLEALEAFVAQQNEQRH